MKIMQINCVYNTGSTGKLTYCIHKKLIDSGMDSVICYGRGEKVNDKNIYKVCSELFAKANNLVSRFTGVIYGGCFFSTKKLLKVIKNENPDVVHIQCINGYFVNIYKLVDWLKKNKVSTVITLHAEFMYTANCSHSFDCTKWKEGCGKCSSLKNATGSLLFDRTDVSFERMKKAFENFDNVIIISVSEWLKKRAEQSAILKNKSHKVILNGVDTGIYSYYENAKIKNRYCKEDEKLILHVTPYFSNQENDVKGGIWILKLAERLQKYNYKVVIAGENRVLDEVPSNIVFLGKINDEVELAKLYSSADLTLITSRRETFSMIVAESLCCGTPIVGFKAGAPEEIGILEYCSFVEYGNLDGLVKEVVDRINNPICKKKIEEGARKKYSSETMFKQYLETYESLCDKK